MLVNLSHVTNMRNHTQSKLSRQQADREEFGDSRNPRAVHLHDLKCFRLHEVLKHDSIRNVLAQRNGDWPDCLSECAVSSNIVRVGGFLHEVRRHVLKLCAHLQRTWKSPLLVSVDHDQRLGASKFAEHEGAPHIALAIAGADLSFERAESLLYRPTRQL